MTNERGQWPKSMPIPNDRRDNEDVPTYNARKQDERRKGVPLKAPKDDTLCRTT